MVADHSTSSAVSRTDYSSLIEEGRVHRSVYTDPSIFDAEMQRIWGQAWIFVGHTSMVAEAGDFITSSIGLQPVIMVRDRDNEQIRVLLNRCGHRGVCITQKRFGNVLGFRCPYHGWMYGTDGALAGVPHSVGYRETDFDRAARCYSLRQIPRVDEYRGFVFASLSPEGPSLENFLGETKSTIDNLVDRSPLQRIRVVGRVCNRFDHPANWKNFIENLNDAMHPMVAHSATTKATQAYESRLEPGSERPEEAEVISPFGGSYQFFDEMGQTVLPNGHSYMGGEASILSEYTLSGDYFQCLESAYGNERAKEILSQNRHNTTIYPSLAVRDAVQSIRVVRPVSVDRTIIETWIFELEGAPKDLLDRTLLYSRLINAPGSMVGPDDLDCYRRMQQGLSSTVSDWVDFKRFIGSDNIESDDKTTGKGTSDLVFRNQYKAWLHYMNGRNGRDD